MRWLSGLTSEISGGPAAQCSSRRGAWSPSAALRVYVAHRPSRALAQKDVGRTFAREEFRTFIAQRMHIDVVQEMLPGTE